MLQVEADGYEEEGVEEEEEDEVGSFLGALALSGGDGVVIIFSPSSRGLIRGVLITPLITSSADSLRSFSRSSEQLPVNEHPFNEEGVKSLPFRDNLLFFLDRPEVWASVPFELLPLERDSNVGGDLCLPEVPVVAAACTADGGDFKHGGVSSRSIFMKVARVLVFAFVISEEW